MTVARTGLCTLKVGEVDHDNAQTPLSSLIAPLHNISHYALALRTVPGYGSSTYRYQVNVLTM